MNKDDYARLKRELTELLGEDYTLMNFLKNTLKTAFDMDIDYYDISGGKGLGLSEDEPIILHWPEGSAHYNFVGLEYHIIKLIMLIFQIKSWERVRQGLMGKNGRHYDVITVETSNVIAVKDSASSNNRPAKITYDFYFDITECFGKD